MTGPSLKPNSLTIIVPVYNDKDSILQTKTRLEKVLSDQPFESRVLFVDDGSTDGARDLLREHGIDHVAHERNQGYGAAIKTGAQHVKTEFLAIIDCDGSYPPEEIPRLMECAPDYDMVVGARDVRINPPLHRMAKRVVCHVLTALFDQNVRDINSGLRIFRTKVFREYSPGLCDRFSLTSSVTYGFLLDKRPIKYLPIAYHKRVGESKVRRVSFTKSFLESLVVMRRFCLARRAQAGESQETPPPQSRVRKIGPPLAVFLLGLLFAAFFMWPQLRDPYASHGDVFQHTWWMVTYHHPELYPGAPYGTYARSLSTPGFQALYF
ncbi:glycosyltransferase family 2 protein, partial [bacterium]|nr:glycosyltransferase family 2 protein [bacterium]